MSNGAHPLIQRARSAIERRDYVAALADLREVVENYPHFADVHHMLGICLSMMGQTEDAVAEFDRAVEANPHYVEAHLNRAITLNELGRFDEATEAFEHAADAEARVGGRFAASVSARIANAHAAVGDLYMAARAPADAAEEFRRALALRPTFPDIRNRLGEALLQVGDAGSARTEFERALEAAPTFFRARLNLGLALLRLGDADGARAEWEECRVLQPESPQLRAFLCLLEQPTEEHAGGVG